MGRCVSKSLVILAAGLGVSTTASGQASYRNLDAGFPVRVEDATVTERYALDLDFLNFRYDELSDLRTRVQYEPSVSYGILPRTEAWVRVPIFYRERTAAPRAGIAGFGVGAMYQLNLESLHLPSVALATEIFRPTGPNELPASYSLKALMTRSFAPVRIHLNASVASFAVRTGPSLGITCPPGSTCGGPPLPPLDGPCSLVAPAGLGASLFCAAPEAASFVHASQAVTGEIQAHNHWLVGAGVDKALPLSSTVFIADFFAEKFEGLGRRTDLTSEFGARRQLTPRLVISGALGRHFRGAGQSTFITAALTFSRAFQPWRRGE